MFGTLYRFELKKVLQKPYVRLLLALMVAVTLFLNVRSLFAAEQVAYVEADGALTVETVSHYERIQLERRFAREDTGILLDNAAAQATRELNLSYQNTGEAEEAPGYLLRNHILVSDALLQMTVNPLTKEPDRLADFAYESMDQHQQREYQGQSLTQEETEYWEQTRSQLTTPFRLAYAKGYNGILNLSCRLHLLVLVFVLISLCSSFSDDHLHGTWPMLTSAKHGRRSLFLARLAAGESVACGSLLLLYALTAAVQFFVHGADGAGTPIQLLTVEALRSGSPDALLCGSSRLMTAGQAVLVTMGMSLLVNFFAAALSMLLSKLFRRAIPALAIPLGLLLLSLIFEVQFYHIDRVRAQIWSYLPIQRLSETFLLDERLVSVGGIQLDCIAASFLLYGGLALLCLLVCFRLCRRDAVSNA